ncbi:MAG: Mrp family chromosome partitioning ATPase/capsular polysaccharide biosynthesis protein [Candidatus Poriferisodalaceae bacterium]|jgi:Mrp family chromosome partitioning ATPase/capsular polysaccharide biosynthesis protein
MTAIGDQWRFDVEIVAEDEFETKRRLRSLRRAVPFIVAMAVCGGVCGWVMGSRFTVSYEASARLEITTDSLGTANDTIDNDAIEARRRILTSTEAYDTVFAGLPDGSDTLNITALVAEKSHLISVSTESSTPEAALTALDLLVNFYVERGIAVEVEDIDRQLRVAEAQRLQLIGGLEVRTDQWLASLRGDSTQSVVGAEHNMWADGNALFSIEAQIFDLRTARSLADGDVQIINRATSAYETGVSRRLVAIAGFFLGAASLTAIVVLYSSRDDRIRSLFDLDEVVGNLPLLATVSLDGGNGMIQGAEHLRLSLSSPKLAGWHSLAIVGAGSDVRSDEVLCALAESYSHAGNEILAIEGDPVGSNLLRLLKADQLSTSVPQAILAMRAVADMGVADLDCFVSDVRPSGWVAGAGQVAVLATGSSDEQERRIEVVPEDFETVLASLGSNPRMILVDGGPVSAVADSVGWATTCDLAVVVIRLGRTKRRDVHRAMKLLTHHDATIAGVVISHDRAVTGHRQRQLFDDVWPTTVDRADIDRRPSEPTTPTVSMSEERRRHDRHSRPDQQHA